MAQSGSGNLQQSRLAIKKQGGDFLVIFAGAGNVCGKCKKRIGQMDERENPANCARKNCQRQRIYKASKNSGEWTLAQSIHQHCTLLLHNMKNIASNTVVSVAVSNAIRLIARYHAGDIMPGPRG